MKGASLSILAPFVITMTEHDKRFMCALAEELSRRQLTAADARKEDPKQIVFRETDVVELLKGAIQHRPSIFPTSIEGFRFGKSRASDYRLHNNKDYDNENNAGQADRE